MTAASLAGYAYENVGSRNMVRIDNSSGTCGEGLSYSLDAYGTLMITGKGAMDDYVKYGAPWYPYGDIKSVIIGSGVTRIGNNAFYDCDSITSVTINGDAAIGDGAFSGCGAIKTVSIKGACPSIGARAFYDCDSLRMLSIPDSVVYIGSQAFYDCDSLKSATVGNGGTAIWDEAFYDCDSLASFTAGCIASIADGAFNGCDILSRVVIGDGATHIGDRAFYSCFELSELSIPGTLTYIGDGAFYGCSKLTFLSVPACLEYLGDFAFYPLELYDGDEPLDHDIEVLAGRTFDGGDGKLYMSQSAVGTLFSREGIDYIVTSLDPAEVEVVGCDQSIVDLAIPDTVSFRLIDFAVVSVGASAFYGDKTLSSADLGFVRTVGSKAFANCSGIKDLRMPSVASISSYAFYRCTGLSHAEFSDSLSSVGKSAFSGVKMYYSGIEVSKAADLRGVVFEGSKGVLRAGACVGETFSDDGLTYSVTSLEPAEVSIVGHEDGISRLFVPDSVFYAGAEFKVSFVGSKAFYGCTSLVSADLGPVEAIGSKAFANCSSLVSVRMAFVSVVGDYAFYMCSRIAILDLGSVSEIGSQAFRGLAGLVFVQFSDSLSEVGQYAFHSVKFYRDGSEVKRTVDGLRGHAFAKADGILAWI